MVNPSASEIQQLGTALVNAIRSKSAWPIRLEIMDLKREIVGFNPQNEVIFRIAIEGSWV